MRALSVTVIVELVQDDRVLEARTEAMHTLGQDGIEELRKRAHDELDAAVFGLAARLPLTYGPEGQAQELAELLRGWVADIEAGELGEIS